MPPSGVPYVVNWHVILANRCFINCELVDDDRIAQSFSDDHAFPILHAVSPFPSLLTEGWDQDNYC